MSRDQFWLTKAQFSKIKPHLPTYCVSRKLDPDVLVMKSAEDRA